MEPLKELVTSKYRVEALGRQLIIVDVQEIFPASEKILPAILDYAKGFDDIIYVYDMMSAGEHTSKFDMFRALKDSGHLTSRMKIHEKEFGFLREMMDTDWDDEPIRAVVRFMYNHEMHDIRDIDRQNLGGEWDEYATKHKLQKYNYESQPAFITDEFTIS